MQTETLNTIDKTVTKPKDRPQNKNLKRDAGPGRPPKQRNYATIYREALLKIAQIDKITPEDLENDMIAMAVKKARKGDPIFYKDVMDRIHGKPVQPTDLTTQGEKISFVIQQDVATKYTNTNDGSK